MSLLIFRYLLNHMSRISRVLRTSGGHALLVGVGGSGRQSITRLATQLAEYSLFQPKVTKNYGVADWRDYLKVALKTAGVEGKKVVLLLTDSQIPNEAILEDVDGLLNSGEVPNLFTKDEKQEIVEVSFSRHFSLRLRSYTVLHCRCRGQRPGREPTIRHTCLPSSSSVAATTCTSSCRSVPSATSSLRD